MISRIRQIIDYYEYTTHSFEQKISVSQGTIGKVLLGKISPKVDTLLKIFANFPEISSDWLLLGRGEMLRKNEKNTAENINISTRQCGKVNNITQNIDTTAEPRQRYGSANAATIQALQDAIRAQQDTIDVQKELIAELRQKIATLESRFD